MFYARAPARREPRTPTLSEYHSAQVPLYWLKPSMVGERGPTPEPALKLTGECWRITIHKQGWKQPPSRRCIHKFFFYFLLVSKLKKRVQLYGSGKSCRKSASYKRTILRKKKCGVVRTVQLYGARKSCKNRAEVNALMHSDLGISKGVARTTAQFFSIYKAPPRRNFYKKFCTFLFRLLAPEYEEISIFVLSISVLCAMMIIYLTLPKYLGEWCLHDWGDANGVVRFPRGSAENDVLEMQLDKLPEGAEPQLREDGQIAIEIPDFKSKPAPYWCVLSEYARKVLTHVIMVRFRVQLWNDLYKVEKLSLPITDCIYDWMERHGIEPEEKSWEAIRQMFFRQRKAYREGQTPPKR